MTLPASHCRFLALATLVLLPALSQAQNSATAAVTHSSAASGTLTPAAMSSVLNAAQSGSDQPKFLTPDQAFQVAATAVGPDRVRIDWQIADGYYLYRSRIKVKTASPVQLGALALPQA